MTTTEKMLWFAVIALIYITHRQLSEMDEKLENKFSGLGYQTNEEFNRQYERIKRQNSEKDS